MALTVNDFSGAEIEGMEETSAAGADATASTANPRSGTHHYRLARSVNGNMQFAPFSIIADAGTGYGLGFALSVDDATPANNKTILNLREDGSSVTTFFTLTIAAGGDLLIIDAGGSTIRTVTAPFSDNTYHYVAVYFQHQASGTVEVFIDGTTQGSDSAQDLTDGGTFDEISFSNNAVVGFETLDIEDYYLLSGATSSADIFKNAECFAYQQSKGATGVPDAGIAGGAADTLDQSTTWDDTDNGLDTDWGEYEDANDGGSNDLDGPADDANIDGDSNIKAIKGMFRVNRAGGGAAQHYLALGNSGDGNSPTLYDDDVPDWGPITTDITTYFVINATVPTASEDIRLGFGKGTGAGQDMFMYDSWGFLLHVPDVVAADDGDPYWIASGDQQPVFGPFEVISY